MKNITKFFIIFLILIFNSCNTFNRQLESSYISIGENILPSVVEIISIGIEEEAGNNWQDFFQDQEDFQSDQMNTGVGSGVILESRDNSYYILTNKHVVGDLEKVSVLLYDDTLLDGEVIGFDTRFDIAVVKIETDNEYPVAKIGKAGSVKVGQFVAALGSPMSYVQSISMGIVSNYGRFGGPKDNVSNYIQTDAAINHGNSGGPLVNMNGEVIGINTWISSPTSGNIGIGFAMPIENLYPSFQSILENGSVNIGWLGVSSYGFPNSEFYTEKKGAFINQIVLESPAYFSGLKAGDIVTSINNHEINSSEELFLQISLLEPNEIAKIILLRDEEELHFEISLANSADNVLETSKNVFPGFILGKRDDNIVILQVLPKSIGSSSGFFKEDIIISVNDKKLENIEDFYSFITDDNNQILILRMGEEIEELKLDLNF